ncbi:trafficking protein particle complex subunit-like protein [Leishmania tarentolae]|uniref:Trafficking protein particle complex subunit n=1 Tax=Leishmania tarentolae TaxID=5689 RepID=A0A640KCS7_LEITA|nr:trafficking protein particle complex subunit-like protein [Leishmania tarentolae]
MSSSAQRLASAVQLGNAAFDNNVKMSAEFLALTYGALVQQMVEELTQEDDVEHVNQQLYHMGHRIGARLIEEYSVRSGAAPCRTFTQAAEGVALVGLRMFLGVSAEVTQVKDAADTFAISFQDNPLALFVELPDGPLRECLWYSNILCGVITGALSLVGLQTEARFSRDKLRGDSKNEIILHFKGRERETFQVERN